MSTGGANPFTNLGGSDRRFPTTLWSNVLGGEGRQPAFGDLAQSYWKPIYAYVRFRWAKSNEDAKDLTQAFFVWMMETDFVGRADPQRGRFRAFLKVALDHFLAKDYQKSGRKKRGGDRVILTLDDVEYDLPSSTVATPEEALDQAWKAELLSRATDRLEDLYTKEGKKVVFEVFQDYFLADTELDYKQVAEKYGIKTSDVSNYLTRSKKRLYEVLKELVSDTVQGTDELNQEMTQLFGDGPK